MPVVAYQTAWLKYYYPVEFMASCDLRYGQFHESIGVYTDLSENEYRMLPPDINEGEGGFSVAGNAIRYGLSAIKVWEGLSLRRSLQKESQWSIFQSGGFL